MIQNEHWALAVVIVFLVVIETERGLSEIRLRKVKELVAPCFTRRSSSDMFLGLHARQTLISREK